MNLTIEFFEQWMNNFKQKICDNKQYLNDLDDAIGDGDHGSNMGRGMNAVIENLETNRYNRFTKINSNVFN